MLGLMYQSITIVRPTIIDDRGTPVPDYDNPASTQVVNECSVQPGSPASAEVLAARQGVSVKFTVYAPPGLQVDAHDAVLFEGVLYSIDGDPARWPSPTGGLDNTVLSLISFRG